MHKSKVDPLHSSSSNPRKGFVSEGTTPRGDDKKKREKKKKPNSAVDNRVIYCNKPEVFYSNYSNSLVMNIKYTYTIHSFIQFINYKYCNIQSN